MYSTYIKGRVQWNVLFESVALFGYLLLKESLVLFCGWEMNYKKISVYTKSNTSTMVDDVQNTTEKVKGDRLKCSICGFLMLFFEKSGIHGIFYMSPRYLAIFEKFVMIYWCYILCFIDEIKFAIAAEMLVFLANKFDPIIIGLRLGSGKLKARKFDADKVTLMKKQIEGRYILW